MNVFLSMAMTGEVDRMIPSNCLLVLASMAEKAGHPARIVFPVHLEQFLERTDGLDDCDVFGFSVNSFNWTATKAAIARIHQRNPRTTIILGGPHPTYLDRHCLATSAASIVFRGESERSFPRVLDALAGGRSLEGIRGITWKSDSGEMIVNPDDDPLSLEEMNALPFPAFEKIQPGLYDFAPVETSRGCLFHCRFCSLPFPQSLRVFSLARVRNVLSFLNDERGRFANPGIFITDDSFTAHKQHAIGSLNLLRELTPQFRVSVEGRISEIVKHDLLKELDRTNLSMLQIGVECGYEEGLQTIAKDLTLEAVTDFARTAASHPLRSQLLWSYIVGFPWEREHHVLKTINYAFDTAALSGSGPPQINNFAPYPGTPIVEEHERYGLPRIPPDHYDDPSWFSTSFLGLTQIPACNATFILNYLGERRRLYPAFPWSPFIYLPDGVVLENAAVSA